MSKTIFEKSISGHHGVTLPASGAEEIELEKHLPEKFIRKSAPELPEVTELETMRHFITLSHKNHSIDTGFYPLGSCTMKYNPKINEKAARLDGFASTHPYQPIEQTQGCLELLHELGEYLKNLTGLDAVSLQPAAGAHGEMTGMMMIQAYHRHNGQHQRTKVICPDSAHGTNPSSAALCGFKVLTVRSDERGQVDMIHFNELLEEHGNTIAGLMLTNPNTLGIFEENILTITKRLHEVGGLIYYDGANLNAIMGMARPGDMGFDVVHLNLHKTFSTPHGGGGPGAGPVVVRDILEPFLPQPVVKQENDQYILETDRPLTIGRIRSFFGNFGVLVRAYTYIRSMGPNGLKQASQDAVLNANYLKEHLKDTFDLPHSGPCMHEFVLSSQSLKKETGVNTLAIAKRLMDYNIHPPTVYFPLVVPEALMIEPTETENIRVLNNFIEVMKTIAIEAKENPDTVLNAPHTTTIKRIDEATANRKPLVNWFQSTK